MIDVQEHVYDDDPQIGHPDVRTRLKNACYFFIGNGLVQAAIQFTPAGEGTPIGLIVMNPEKLSKKRDALSFDVEYGFEKTMLLLEENGEEQKAIPGKISSSWCYDYEVPAVRVQWATQRTQVMEIFYCPNQSQAKIIREIQLKNITWDTLYS